MDVKRAQPQTDLVAIVRLQQQLFSSRAQQRLSSLYELARLVDRDQTTLVWRLADDPDLEVRLALVETADALLLDPDPLLRYMATDPNTEVRDGAKRRIDQARP